MTTTIDHAKHQCSAHNAALMQKWFAERGGILVWSSADFSNPAGMTGPYRDENGNVNEQPPHWRLAKNPRHITDIGQVEVCVDKEVKRFRVGVRMGAQGFKIKVTDGGSRRIRAEVAKAGSGAHYVFDYETQEAVILAPEKVIPLAEWKEAASEPAKEG